mmetsp:Transcript_4123/g.7960  ORF Transcript_4123/g.7960 Transcript_4123/m.7960 type:complete len:138 (-) Transcript_4123:61-474(-)
MKRQKWLFLIVNFCILLITTKSINVTIQNSRRQNISSSSTVSRRGFGKASLLGGCVLLNLPIPARALKEKNEVLCGTGFFTNIAQYMCTELGDISDEGKSKSLSSTQVDSTDSLIDKLGIKEGDNNTENDSNKSEGK